MGAQHLLCHYLLSECRCLSVVAEEERIIERQSAKLTTKNLGDKFRLVTDTSSWRNDVTQLNKKIKARYFLLLVILR